jgi:pyruvate,water dikinase
MRLQGLLGEAGANALTSGLGGGQAGQLASLGLLDGLDQLARAELDRDAFNRRYGHRGPHEFEISTPRPAEDPTWIDDQLAQRAESTGTAYADLLAEQRRRRRRPGRAGTEAPPGRPGSSAASSPSGPGSPGTGSGRAAR